MPLLGEPEVFLLGEAVEDGYFAESTYDLRGRSALRAGKHSEILVDFCGEWHRHRMGPN